MSGLKCFLKALPELKLNKMTHFNITLSRWGQTDWKMAHRNMACVLENSIAICPRQDTYKPVCPETYVTRRGGSLLHVLREPRSFDVWKPMVLLTCIGRCGLVISTVGVQTSGSRDLFLRLGNGMMWHSSFVHITKSEHFKFICYGDIRWYNSLIQTSTSDYHNLKLPLRF